MAQLHEVLAVESTLESQAKKLIAESLRTLDKENLFKGQTRTLSHFSEDDKILDTTDTVTLTSTVDENIDYTTKAIAKYWDAVLQKEATNQQASADIVVDGKVIAENVPATFLLGLERKLTEVRGLYESAHTLPPGKDWVQDPQERAGVYKTTSKDVQFKEEKKPKFITIAEATEKHAAQVIEKTEVIKVGKYETSHQCGLWTPIEKAEKISKIDSLILAVKRARQRANQQEIDNRTIGASLFDFING